MLIARLLLAEPMTGASDNSYLWRLKLPNQEHSVIEALQIDRNRYGSSDDERCYQPIFEGAHPFYLLCVTFSIQSMTFTVP